MRECTLSELNAQINAGKGKRSVVEKLYDDDDNNRTCSSTNCKQAREAP